MKILLQHRSFNTRKCMYAYKFNLHKQTKRYLTLIVYKL